MAEDVRQSEPTVRHRWLYGGFASRVFDALVFGYHDASKLLYAGRTGLAKRVLSVRLRKESPGYFSGK
jgi:hypothetical protein